MLRWYVIQTYTGREEKLVRMVRRVVPRQLYDDCFVIYHEQLWRRQGGCQVHVRRVFPGYVFITSEDPEGLFLCLKGVPAMSRLLADGVLAGGELTFLSLSQGEARILGRLMDADHIIRLSYVATDGKNHVSYVSGPLGTYLSGGIWSSSKNHPDFSDDYVIGHVNLAKTDCPESRHSNFQDVCDTDHIPARTGCAESLETNHSNTTERHCTGSVDMCQHELMGMGHLDLSKGHTPCIPVTYQFRKRYASVKVTLSGDEKEVRLGIILNDDIRRELAYGKVETPVGMPEIYQLPGGAGQGVWIDKENALGMSAAGVPGTSSIHRSNASSGMETGKRLLGSLGNCGKGADKPHAANSRTGRRDYGSGLSEAAFAPGNAVTVTEGPLAGMPAVMVGMRGQAARVRAHLLGRWLEVEVSAGSLKKMG